MCLAVGVCKLTMRASVAERDYLRPDPFDQPRPSLAAAAPATASKHTSIHPDYLPPPTPARRPPPPTRLAQCNHRYDDSRSKRPGKRRPPFARRRRLKVAKRGHQGIQRQNTRKQSPQDALQDPAQRRKCRDQRREIASADSRQGSRIIYRRQGWKS